MKISKTTLSILKNFAAINGNILINEGKLLLTKSPANNITVEFTAEEEFPVEFGIYDLSAFLGVLSLFQDPDLAFTEKYVTISEGKNRVKYFGADKSILAYPKKRMTFDLVGADSEISFDLTAEQINQIIKTSAVLRVPDLIIECNGKAITAVVSDASKPSSNSYSLDIGAGSTKCSIRFKVENLKMLQNDYRVDISVTKKISRFTCDSLVYHVAVEDESSRSNG